MGYDSLIRTKQLNKPEVSGYILDVVGQFLRTGSVTGIATNTGQLTGQFYPLGGNPSGYVNQGQLSGYATLLQVTGNNATLLASIANAYYPLTNPSGFISSGDAALHWMPITGGTLSSFQVFDAPNGVNVIDYVSDDHFVLRGFFNSTIDFTATASFISGFDLRSVTLEGSPLMTSAYISGRFVNWDYFATGKNLSFPKLYLNTPASSGIPGSFNFSPSGYLLQGYHAAFPSESYVIDMYGTNYASYGLASDRPFIYGFDISAGDLKSSGFGVLTTKDLTGLTLKSELLTASGALTDADAYTLATALSYVTGTGVQMTGVGGIVVSKSGAVFVISGGSSSGSFVSDGTYVRTTGAQSIRGSKIFYDPSSVPILSTEDRWLYANNGNIVGDWGVAILNDSDQQASVEWSNRRLKDYAGNISLDWQSGWLKSGSTIVLDWRKRTMYGAWNVSGQLTVNNQKVLTGAYLQTNGTQNYTGTLNVISGNFTVSGKPVVTGGPYYPRGSNPSGYMTMTGVVAQSDDFDPKYFSELPALVIAPVMDISIYPTNSTPYTLPTARYWLQVQGYQTGINNRIVYSEVVSSGYVDYISGNADLVLNWNPLSVYTKPYIVTLFSQTYGGGAPAAPYPTGAWGLTPNGKNGINYSDIAPTIILGTTGRSPLGAIPNYVTWTGFIVQKLNVTGNNLTGDLAVTGIGGINVFTSGNTLVISGGAGGSSSSGGVSNISVTGNNLSGSVIFSGAGGITVSTIGNTVVTSGWDTGQYVTSAMTGQFVVKGNTGNFITTSQTGQFAPSGMTGQFITTAQTGQFMTTGQSGLFYLKSNPSGFITERYFQTGIFDQNTTGLSTYIYSGHVFGDTRATFGQEYMSAFYNRIISGYTGLRILCVGDSTTEGARIRDYKNAVHSMINLKIAADFPGLGTAYNSGVGGSTTNQWYTGMLANQMSTNPDVMIIRYGLNDASNPPNTFLSTLRSGMKYIRDIKDSPDLSVILMTPNVRTSVVSGFGPGWLQAVNSGIRDIARDYRCGFIDTYSLWPDGQHASGWMFLEDGFPYYNGDQTWVHPEDPFNIVIGSVTNDFLFPSQLKVNYGSVYNTSRYLPGYTEVRNLDVITGAYVNLGSTTHSSYGQTWLINLGPQGNSQIFGKGYLVGLGWGVPSTWQTVNPLTNYGRYGLNDIDLEVMASGATTYFRATRSAGNSANGVLSANFYPLHSSANWTTITGTGTSNAVGFLRGAILNQSANTVGISGELVVTGSLTLGSRVYTSGNIVLTGQTGQFLDTSDPVVWTTGNQNISGIKKIQLLQLDGSSVSGSDIHYPGQSAINSGVYRGLSDSESSGPQSLVEFIHTFAGMVGAPNPIAYAPVSNQEYLSGNSWFTDTNPPNYGNILGGRALFTPIITTAQSTAGISGKRFVIDAGQQFSRTNFWTFSRNWDQNDWGYQLSIESSTSTTGSYNSRISGVIVPTSKNAIIGLNLTNASLAPDQYFRVTILQNQPITVGNLSFSAIHALSSAGNINLSVGSNSGGFIFANGFISGTTNIGSLFVTTGQTGAFYPRFGNPAGYLTAATAGGVGALLVTGTSLSGAITISGAAGISVITGLSNTIVISGWDTGQYVTSAMTGQFITTAKTGNFAPANSTVYTTGNQNVSGVKRFQLIQLDGNSVSGSDIHYPAASPNNSGVYRGLSDAESNGPQSLVEFIHSFAGTLGAPNPIAFSPAYNPEYLSGNTWFTDTNPPTYSNILGGRPLYTPVITAAQSLAGISGKRFVVDSNTQYNRANFWTISRNWDQNDWGYQISIESSTTTGGAYNSRISGAAIPSNKNGIVGFNISNANLAADQYYRITIIQGQTITTGNLSFTALRALASAGNNPLTIGANSDGLIFSNGFISGTTNLGAFFVNSGQTGVLVSRGETGNAFYPRFGNPAGYLTASTAGGVGSIIVTGTSVSGAITLSGAGGISISTGTANRIVISGWDTGQYITTAQTGNFVTTNSPQNINAFKAFNASVTFNNGFIAYDNLGFGSIFTNLRTLTASDESPSIDWDGRILTGNWKAQTLNISGFPVVISYQTGQFVDSSKTGQFITTAQTGNFAPANRVVFTTGDQIVSGIKKFQLVQFDGNSISGSDIHYPGASANNSGVYRGISASTSDGPQSLIEFIHSLGSSIGAPDPLRFKTITNQEMLSGGAWIPDTFSAYPSLFAGSPSSIPILTANQSLAGISGKRFVIDAGQQYTRPNFWTIARSWDQGDWGYSVSIESSTTTGSYTSRISGASIPFGRNGTVGFNLGDIGGDQYFRVSFVQNQTITTGNLTFFSIKTVSAVGNLPLGVGTTSGGLLFANGFISGNTNIGALFPTRSETGQFAPSGMTGQFITTAQTGIYATAANLVATGNRFIAFSGAQQSFSSAIALGVEQTGILFPFAFGAIPRVFVTLEVTGDMSFAVNIKQRSVTGFSVIFSDAIAEGGVTLHTFATLNN